MKRFLIISLTIHVILFFVFAFGNFLSFLFPHPEIKQSNTIRIEFLDKLPENKKITQAVITKPKDKPKPKEEIKETSPPPKPDPGIKTKVTAPKPTKKEPVKEEPKKVAAPKEKPKKDKVVLKKDKQTPPKKEKDKKVEETAKKNPKPDPKQDKVEKPSPGIEKKKQEVESVDALLNTLLPDAGGKPDKNAKKFEEPEESAIPEQLSNAMIDAIRSQIQDVWSPISDDFNFHLLISVDQSGTITADIKILGTEGQSAQQIANAESAYRAAKRLGQFVLDPEIFKPEYYGGEHGWAELEIDFKPQH